MRPVLRPESGMQFPNERLAESMSRNGGSKWGVLSYVSK